MSWWRGNRCLPPEGLRCLAFALGDACGLFRIDAEQPRPAFGHARIVLAVASGGADTGRTATPLLRLRRENVLLNPSLQTARVAGSKNRSMAQNTSIAPC